MQTSSWITTEFHIEEFERGFSRRRRALAVSTLRGQLTDNQLWSADPARPSVIVGTVDMIGSRMLFAGYGIGWKSQPLHAGFLGQDSIIIHDECHLEPAFQSLLESIRNQQIASFHPAKIIALSATPRKEQGATLELDHNDPILKKRLRALKKLTVHTPADESRARLHSEPVGAVPVAVR